MNYNSFDNFLCDGKSGFEKAKKIGLIDCDLSSGRSHYPNLALMKLSSYYKTKGCEVRLITYEDANPNNLFGQIFDIVFASKVFTDTRVPDFVMNTDYIHIGGTGFYYNKATPLHYDIEHSYPTYNLYSHIKSLKENKFFTDFSIGFMTRGCIRGCEFCVNRDSKKSVRHSSISEFINNDKPFIMLWDDNVTANKDFISILNELDLTGKPYVFKQGLDIRLLNGEKMQRLWRANYFTSNKSKGTRIYHFAFDNIADYSLIEKRLKEYYYNKPYSFKVFFYVLTGFDRSNKYDDEFYIKDIKDLLRRIELLFKYNAYPYVMLHQNYKKNPNFEVMRQICRVCNTPMMITNKTMGEALKQSKFKYAIDYLNKYDSWFLDIMFNSKLPYRAKNLKRTVKIY